MFQDGQLGPGVGARPKLSCTLQQLQIIQIILFSLGTDFVRNTYLWYRRSVWEGLGAQFSV